LNPRSNVEWIIAKKAFADLIWNGSEQNGRSTLFLAEIVFVAKVIANLFFLLAGNVVQAKWHPLAGKLTTLLGPSGVLC
jgi:hypothetical protein